LEAQLAHDHVGNNIGVFFVAGSWEALEEVLGFWDVAQNKLYAIKVAGMPHTKCGILS
jgi:hypothetical protein